MEQHYVFLKNNVVELIAVFASKDEELADRIAIEQNYDDAVWVGEDKPHLYSSYDGKKFTPPTEEYLVERGILAKTSAESSAALAVKAATPTE